MGASSPTSGTWPSSGLLEVLRHLRRLRAVFRSVLEEVERERPAVAVLVDYPDFNLRLARELKRRGIPVVYYVSPQVWAWRRGRMRAIRESVAQMLVIFPFEEPLYREARRAGHVRGPPARRPGAARGGPRRVPRAGRGSTPRGRWWPCCPAAGRRRWRTTSRRSRARSGCCGRDAPDLQFVLAVAPSLDPALLDPA